jgi:hypothetical protein
MPTQILFWLAVALTLVSGGIYLLGEKSQGG